MIASRFWYLVLSAIAGAALGAALLAHGIFNRQYDINLEDSLRRDRREVEAALKLEARAQIDQLGNFVGDGDLRSLLRDASARTNDANLATLNTRARERLTAINTSLRGYAGDIVFAVDRNGVVIAQIGPSPTRFGAGIGTFPLVARALDGYVRDDTWVYDGVAYRMAARPVIQDGQYVGAVVHGKKFDAELCERLARRLDGATVAFFRGNAPLASYTPADVAGAPSQSDVSAPLADVEQDPKLRAGDVTDTVDLQGHGRAIFSLVTGTASDLSVGYAIARPRSVLATPYDIFGRATHDDMTAVPWPLVGGAAFVLFLAGMLFVFLERDRPLRKLRRASAELAEGKLDRLDLSQFGGGYRKIADSMNTALQKMAEKAGAAGPQPSNLDAILGPAPNEPAGSFFAFATPGESPAELSIPPVPPSDAPPRIVVPRAAPAPVIIAPAPAPAAPPPQDAQPMEYAPTLQGQAPAPPPQAPAPVTAPAAAAAPAAPPRAAAPTRPAGAAPPAAPGQRRNTPGPMAPVPATPRRPQAAPASPGAPRAQTPQSMSTAQSPPLPTPGGSPRSVTPPTMAALDVPSVPQAPAVPAQPAMPARPVMPEKPAAPAQAAPVNPAKPAGTMRRATMIGMPDRVPDPPTRVAPPPASGTGSGTHGGSFTSPGVEVEEEDGATMITRVPEELIQATASGQQRVLTEEQLEDVHFREVYDEFLKVKKQCNEQTLGLSFEKFLLTLRRNKDAILQKHGGKRVRFSVYVKDGKAALKATPIKD